ncbi:MAG: prolipoprotein diacylglyceryl transferase [Clostridia bacterium]|nr:prolipoprotein diacylglyceryl transferase [Clostridia bacterium]
MNTVNYISFPGLGIGEMAINKIALQIGDFNIRWYGIIVTLAIVCGFAFACVRARKINVSFDSMLDYAIFTVISAIIGARLYYVIFSGDTYSSFMEVIAVWNGGLAIYGGLIGGLIAIICVSAVKKVSLAKILDVAAPCVMLGQAIGRWANFINAEAYGYNPDKIALYSENIFRMDIRAEGSEFVRHTLPTFLFESVWNIIGLLILVLVIEKFKKYDGQSVLFYVTWYGFGRAWIEMLRSDSLYISDIRVSSLLGFLCFLAGVILMIILGMKARRKRLDDVEYESIYSNSEESTPIEKGNE